MEFFFIFNKLYNIGWKFLLNLAYIVMIVDLTRRGGEWSSLSLSYHNPATCPSPKAPVDGVTSWNGDMLTSGVL